MTIPDLPSAPLRLRIDRDALASNWRRLDSMSGKARAGAAVKADAYGLGVANVVPSLLAAGAGDFFLAHWCEVPAMLQMVDAASISVLHGVTTPEEARFAIATGVRPVINGIHQAQVWLAAGGGPCHLMVDTGINRLGVQMTDLGNEVIGQLEVGTLLSHLACADEQSDLNGLQLSRFRSAAGMVRHSACSLANSAGIALGADYAFDMTRPGIALYGGIPRAEYDGVILQTVYPEACVIQRRHLSPGESVGYNATYVAPQDMEIATISIGYADGFLRSRAAGVALHHQGVPLPVIGRVSMDMIVVDCTASNTLKEGDFVEIPFDLPQVSAKCGLSQYELLTTLGRRCSRA